MLGVTSTKTISKETKSLKNEAVRKGKASHTKPVKKCEVYESSPRLSSIVSLPALVGTVKTPISGQPHVLNLM